MEEKEIKPIRERVLKNKKLVEVMKKYIFDFGERERGLFVALVEESYNIGVDDTNTKEILKCLKKVYNPNKTTIELSDLFDFFGITEEDVKKDAEKQ